MTKEKNAGAKAPAATAGRSGFLAAIEAADHALFRLMHHGIRNRLFTVFVPAISQLGDRVILWLTLSAFMLFYGGPAEREAVVALMASLAFAGLFAECTIKLFWNRPRPFLVFDDVKPLVDPRRVAHRPSFPSGHSASFFAAAAALSHHYPQFSIGLYVLAGAGAFSRVYTGVHFPSDMAVGIALGFLSGRLALLVPAGWAAGIF